MIRTRVQLVEFYYDDYNKRLPFPRKRDYYSLSENISLTSHCGEIMEIEAFRHQYCFFFKDGNLTAGWVEGIQKKKLAIIPLQGKMLFLPPHRISLHWKDDSSTDKQSALLRLKCLMEQIQQIAKNLDLEVIHELSTPGKSYLLEELIDDFLDDPGDRMQSIAFFFALQNDHRFFKRKKDRYTARTAEELAELDQKLAQEQQQRIWEEKVRQWIVDLQSESRHAESSEEDIRRCNSHFNEEQSQWLRQLRSILIYGKNSGYWKLLAPILNLSVEFNEADEKKICTLLRQAGCAISKSRLILLRASVREEFPKEVLEEAERLSLRFALSEGEKFDEHALTFSIDAETTKDYDDAFSILGWTDNRVELLIHVTDLSAMILPKDPLFEEAESRVSSVYTLDRVFPMFPPSLSEHCFSLKAKNVRRTMSFHFDLYGNGKRNFRGIYFDKIQVAKNLTYEQADHAIKRQQGFWKALSDCCQALRRVRMEQGALDFVRNEVKMDIRNPERIQIIPIDRNTPAHHIVEEMAILVNREVGYFHQRNQCPAIYRVQGPYERIETLKEGESLTPRHFIIEPVRLSIHPERHSGLGCDFYIQATSPIRRFSDLVTQYQLAQFLQHHHIVFQEEQLMGWAEQIQSTQKSYNQAERAIEDHWKFKYLEQNSGAIHIASIKRHLRDGRTEVDFDEIQLTACVSSLSQHEAGDTVFLKIENVNVERQFIAVSLHSLQAGME